MTIPCLRCGTFTDPAALPVAGVALCGACLETRNVEPKRTVWLAPPTPVLLRRLPGAVLVIVATIALTLFLPRGGFRALAALVGGIGAFMALELQPFGTRRWKAIVLEVVGLGHVPDPSGLTFVVYSPRRLRWGDMSYPIDMGVLVEGPGGLAFLGQQGARLAIPRGDIVRVSVEKVLLLPSNAVLTVELRDGSTRCFAYYERADPRGSALAAAARLAPGAAAPPKA